MIWALGFGLVFRVAAGLAGVPVSGVFGFAVCGWCWWVLGYVLRISWDLVFLVGLV